VTRDRSMATEALETAREAYAQGRWEPACRGFEAARAVEELAAGDLATLADAHWWLGRTDESLTLSEQAFRQHLRDEDHAAAAHLAIECGFLWLVRGEPTIGSGWVARAARLLEDLPERPEHGYLLYLDVVERTRHDDLAGALEAAARMRELADRHDDPTLCAIALVLEGTLTIERGHVDEGLSILDEAMLPVHAGLVDPAWSGNLYCQLMDLFHRLGDVPRARAWTDATERWCDRFTNAAMFLGICRVHRAQLLHLEGDWAGAEARALRACRDLADMNVEAVAAARYEIAEVRRLSGDHEGAERAYASAQELGRDPQPGLALLRLRQGDHAAAQAAVAAALRAEPRPLARAPLLAAQAEIGGVTGGVDVVTEAAHELTGIAETYATPGLLARARHVAGGARLLAGESERAIPLLRDACRRWRRLGARHDLACARVLLADALEASGDPEAATRERESAVRILTELGAVDDLRGLAVGPGAADDPPGGLSDRELEVLREVARGRTNRQVAEMLTISERTVERHLSNIFVKLGVGTRTQAAAFAFARGLVAGAEAPGAGRT
jgi:ATP/maltotriose-dependent transcriptional regulator MalT